jgi:hypothetical protein
MHISAGLRGLRIAWLPIVCALLSASAGSAAAEPVRREVLALYDSRHEPAPSETLVHYRAEMPLNHLGYIVDFHDVRDPLPSPEAMARYVAVVTWFTYELEQPTEYLEWAARVAETGVRFIVIGGVGGPTTADNLRLFNRVLAGMGVLYTDEYVDLTLGSVVTRDAKIMGFEGTLDPLLPAFPVIEQISPVARVALQVQAPAIEKGVTSALVVTGPGGAFVSGGFASYYDDELNRTLWFVNPFELFRRALGRAVFPIPDTTTVSGRRLYFSHVDGDAWNNIAEMRRYRDSPTTAAEVMLRELIEPYPDLPVAVGVVAGDLDPILGGGRAAAEIAAKLYALPQVEVASHTWSHPFFWGFYENYDYAAERKLLPTVESGQSVPGPVGRLIASVGRGGAKAEAARQRARYVSGGEGLPRAVMRDPFDLDTEVDRAVREVQALAPAGKSATLYQWSGDTRPFEAAIRATRRAGLRNINGGDTRFDALYPSVGYVAPLSRIAGQERQIYAVNSNENTYTHLWTEHYHGFLDLRETIERTGYPRRLKGVNVYYHTYSAEKQTSLMAVRSHLEWARNAELAPIEASRYAAIADGFFSTRIEKTGDMSWRISERDGMQTVRFDDADDLDADPVRSHGVLGTSRYRGSLYVALDEWVTDAVVALRPREDAAAVAPTAAASLEHARWHVWNLKRRSCGIRYRTRGFGAGEFSWRLPQGLYRIEVLRGQDLAWQDEVPVGPDGRLRATIPVPAIDPVEVDVSCISGTDRG